MKVRYRNLQDDFDPMSGASLSDGATLIELLESRRRKPPFLAQLSGDNGFELTIGIGRNLGCAQHSPSNGDLPYLMAVSSDPPLKRGGFEFLTANTGTPIPARHIVRFKELKEIALHFLVTGDRSDKFAWQAVGPIKGDETRGPWRPTEQQHILRLLGQSHRERRSSAAAHEHQGIRYSDLQNSCDPLSGTIITNNRQLVELLEARRKSEPFVAELWGDRGFCLLIGIGTGIGFAQYRPINGDLPYFMAMPAERHVRRGQLAFFVNNAPTPIPGRYILDFDEMKQVALHFVETGERCREFVWEAI